LVITTPDTVVFLCPGRLQWPPLTKAADYAAVFLNGYTNRLPAKSFIIKIEYYEKINGYYQEDV